ncbi:MAG: hypothetical protein KBF33_04155 [Comamonas sp.]|nr:hypothetical protein [Comamonas sp.]
MTALTFNLQSHAATEYDWDLTSLSSHHATSAEGLLSLGGDTDAGRPIAALATTPVGQHKSSLKKSVQMLYVSTPLAVAQGLEALVELPTGQRYAYPLQSQATGVARAQPGRGIRENYLGFGVCNVAGADFEIERIEVQTHASATRRV